MREVHNQKRSIELYLTVSNWEQQTSMLGKTVWHHGDNSVYIANMDFVQPHGHTRSHSRYCVEAYGPEVSEREEDAQTWYFDKPEEALSKVADIMEKKADPDVVEENFKKLIGEY